MQFTQKFKLFLLELKYSRRAQTETREGTKLLGSNFIKQASSDSVDSSPKAEPQEQSGLSL
jgi:hypothetical protein